MVTPNSLHRPAPEAELRPDVDLTLIGEHTLHRAVQAPDIAPQVWLVGAPVCPVLPRYDMLHLGVVEAVAPYRFVRRSARALEFLACYGGEGRVLIDGEWAAFGPGQAALLPKNAVAAYHAVGEAPWKLVWVCYHCPADRASLLAPGSPVLAEHDPEPLRHAVEGLRLECRDPRGELACMEHGCALIHRHVLRFARPWRDCDRLRLLWEKVARALGEEWSLGRLAAEAGCCGESLRQRCQRQIGRSPMQHLTYLRLQRAAELLLTTDQKVESIAAEVGYGDAFAFSAMFKKWTGSAPRRFRERPSAPPADANCR